MYDYIIFLKKKKEKDYVIDDDTWREILKPTPMR